MKLDGVMIGKIEKALSITLQSWQKAYLMTMADNNKHFVCYPMNRGRTNGKMMAVILSWLLSDHKTPLRIDHVRPERAQKMVREINEKLNKAGIETNLKGDLKMGRSAITKMEREELATRVKAMDPEELEIVLDNIPVELCIERIKRENAKAEAIMDSIKEVIK